MNIADVFSFMAGIAWLGVILLVVLMVVRASRAQPARGFGMVLLIVLVAAVVLTSVGAGIVFVEPDEMGVVITILGAGGIREEPLLPGLHWIVPFAERVEHYSTINKTYTMSSVASEGQVQGDDAIQVRTKDGQQVLIDASVIYAVDKTKAISLYRTWRNNYEADLVRPQARGIIRDVASQYGIEEIVSSKRAEMEGEITSQLEKIFSSNNLLLQDFVLRNIRFSDEYAAAVEQKQIAEQQAQQAKFVVESKKQEAEQARQVAQGAADANVIASKGQAEAKIIQAEADAKARLIQAEAEAKALDLIAKALAENPNLLVYQYINKLAPNIQVMLVPSDMPYLLPSLPSGPTPALPQ